MTTDQSTTDQARETAATAADEGRHVAGVAKDEAQNVVGAAAEQARTVAGDTIGQLRDQVTEQATAQRDRLVSTLQSLGDDLERMADQAGEGGMAADLAREASSRASALRAHLDGRQPGQLLDDVRDLARRRPGTFLLGALAAGVVAGRLLRGTADGAAAATLAEPTPEPAPAAPSASVTPVTPAVPASPASTGPTGPPLAVSTHGQPTIEAP